MVFLFTIEPQSAIILSERMFELSPNMFAIKEGFSMENFKEFAETFIDFEVPFMLLINSSFIETEREVILAAIDVDENEKTVWFREKGFEKEEAVETNFKYEHINEEDEMFIFTLKDNTKITFCFFYL